MIIGLGVDVCDVARIRRALEGRAGARFQARVFTAAERAYCEARRRGRFASYAARFAAKEAAMKALGTGWAQGVGWRDFEVVRARGAPPRLVLHGRAAALALHVCDAILCRLFAHNNGYPKNLWTLLGFMAGLWAVAVLILLPRRGAPPAPPRALR